MTDTASATNLLGYELLIHMPYLAAVMKETLRKYTTNPAACCK